MCKRRHAFPDGSLISDAASDLFGTTYQGGAFISSYTTPLTVEADRAHVQLAGTVTANAANGVLANDTDPIPNDTLIVSAVDGQATNIDRAVAGTYGTLTLNADGSCSYSANSSHALPASGVSEDIFTYTAKDGAGGVADTTLTVVVAAAGLTYVAVPIGGSATQSRNFSLRSPVLCHDGKKPPRFGSPSENGEPHVRWSEHG
jgi:VCBS repeat-containing protein